MAEFIAGFSALPQYQLRCSITQGAQNIPGNATTVNGALYVEKLSGSGYVNYTSGNSGGISGDIAVGAGGWSPYDFTAYTSRLIGSGSGSVAHNADGTKTASGSFSAADTAGGGNMGSASGGWALGLTPIPRGAFDRYTGSVWRDNLFERWDGSAWRQQVLERWNGTAWVRQL